MSLICIQIINAQIEGQFIALSPSFKLQLLNNSSNLISIYNIIYMAQFTSLLIIHLILKTNTWTHLTTLASAEKIKVYGNVEHLSPLMMSKKYYKNIKTLGLWFNLQRKGFFQIMSMNKLVLSSAKTSAHVL